MHQHDHAVGKNNAPGIYAQTGRARDVRKFSLRGLGRGRAIVKEPDFPPHQLRCFRKRRVIFATVSDFTLTINAEATRGSTTFSLTPTDDDVDEDTETLTVSGTTDGLTVDAATLEITDNDAAPTKVILSVDPATVSEGAGGTPITVTGTLDGSARTSATSVTVSVGGATATAGTDFATVSDFTLTINANATRGSTTFSLTPTDDDMYEGAETLKRFS